MTVPLPRTALEPSGQARQADELAAGATGDRAMNVADAITSFASETPYRAAIIEPDRVVRWRELDAAQRDRQGAEVRAGGALPAVDVTKARRPQGNGGHLLLEVPRTDKLDARCGEIRQIPCRESGTIDASDGGDHSVWGSHGPSLADGGAHQVAVG